MKLWGFGEEKGRSKLTAPAILPALFGLCAGGVFDKKQPP